MFPKKGRGLLWLLLLLWAFSAYGQTAADVMRLDTWRGTPSYVSFSEDQSPPLTQLDDLLRTTYGVGKEYDWKLIREDKDELGYRHYRYLQTFHGLPIEGGVFIVHTRNGRIRSWNGTFENQLRVPVRPVILKSQTEQIAGRSIDPEGGAIVRPQGLVVINRYLGAEQAPDFRLAYKYDVRSARNGGHASVFVDATTGEVVASHTHVYHTDTEGQAETTYSGTRPLTTERTTQGDYRLFESGRALHTARYNGGPWYDPYPGIDYRDNDNNWTAAEMPSARFALDAHWGAECTWDYFHQVFGRRSFDGQGTPVRVLVDWNAVNATWSHYSGTIRIGHSPGGNSLSTLDIVGHEFAHGVTYASAGLVYSYESGALNESFSDIFGTAIEFRSRPPEGTGDWTIGEDAQFTIRNMANPNAHNQPDTYLGYRWYSGTGDNGGVHYNSGVQNHWFYLLSEGGSGTNDNGQEFSVSGVGLDAAAEVAYRNLTVYLTPGSTYADACYYSIRAALDLAEDPCNGSLVRSTIDAWHAVGLGEEYQSGNLMGQASFEASQLMICQSGSPTSFRLELGLGSVDPASVEWDFGDGNTSNELSPSHIYTADGLYTVTFRASEQCSGAPIEVVRTDYIRVDSAAPCDNMPANGTQTVTGCRGFLFDTGGPANNYPNYTSSEYTIQSDGSGPVTLHFVDFSFERGWDYLFVYDGASSAAPLIGRFTGNELPMGGTITSTGGSITIRQYTDEYIIDRGFSLYWTADEQPPVPVCFDQTVTFRGETELPLLVEELADIADNCLATGRLSRSSVSCEDIGQTIAVTVSATDVAGLQGNCISQVTVQGLPCGFSGSEDGIGCEGGSSALYDPQSELFTLSATDCYSQVNGQTESVSWAGTEACGSTDFGVEITAIAPYSWAGISLRESDQPGAARISLLLNGGNIGMLEWCSQPGAPVSRQYLSVGSHRWIKMRRTGSQVMIYTSFNGQQWRMRAVRTVSLPDCLQAGMQVSNARANQTGSATFRIVTGQGAAATRPAVPSVMGSGLLPAGVQIYPNPSAGQFTVATGATPAAELQIVDIYGRIVYRQAQPQSREQVELQGLPTGLYFVQLRYPSGEVATEKVLLQRLP